MKRHLDRLALTPHVESEDVGHLDRRAIHELVTQELGSSAFLPEGVVQTDPRNGARIIYNSARSRRPHDNRPEEDEVPDGAPCVICDGKLTGVVDVAELSTGFTFISKNLFPVLFPHSAHPAGNEIAGQAVTGSHFVQWSSSYHQRDWHNMPLVDNIVLVQRLGAMERALLEGAGGCPPNAEWGDDEAHGGYVGIIKNYGRLVGGSLAHGHQQVAHSSVMPQRIAENLAFLRARGEAFSSFMLRENPGELLVRDYGPAALLVPYFMRRPFDMLLMMKDIDRRYIHQLDPTEVRAVAAAWHDAICIMRRAMNELGRELAFNVVTHNGPGAGLYFEFLPYTQEWGGYEHLGLILCQADPRGVAERARLLLEGSEP